MSEHLLPFSPVYTSTVGGGKDNFVGNYAATVPGGLGNTASGVCSFAAGRQVTVGGSNTLGFGYGFTTWADRAVVFYDNTPSFPIKVGIQTTEPRTTADINGDIALRAGSFTAVNGNNNEIPIGQRSFVRITGPTGAFAITGIAGGQDGKIVILYNTTTYNMTIENNSTSSSAANRILTMTTTDEVTNGAGNVTLIYDDTDHRWIVTAIKP